MIFKGHYSTDFSAKETTWSSSGQSQPLLLSKKMLYQNVTANSRGNALLSKWIQSNFSGTEYSNWVTAFPFRVIALGSLGASSRRIACV